jgi:hypothetical protein
MSTFESILFYYKLRDPKLAAIGKIIHDIEINVWARKMMAGSEDVQRAIREIIRTSKDNKTVIKKSCLYFDSLYKIVGKEMLPIAKILPFPGRIFFCHREHRVHREEIFIYKTLCPLCLCG